MSYPGVEELSILNSRLHDIKLELAEELAVAMLGRMMEEVC